MVYSSTVKVSANGADQAVLGVHSSWSIRVMHQWASAQNGTRRIDGHLNHVLGQSSLVIGCTSCVETDRVHRTCRRRRLDPIPTKFIIQSSGSEFLHRRILLLVHNRTERHSGVLAAMTPQWVGCVHNLRRRCRHVILLACSLSRDDTNL